MELKARGPRTPRPFKSDTEATNRCSSQCRKRRSWRTSRKFLECTMGCLPKR
uniref:Uncharacterized protein n=1 Tax=Anguilla anguilla TaxID=7936 RepID=A0A0E9UTL3_ANGAN